MEELIQKKQNKISKSQFIIFVLAGFLIANPSVLGFIFGESVTYKDNAGLSLTEVVARERAASRSTFVPLVWIIIYSYFAFMYMVRSLVLKKPMKIDLLIVTYLLFIISSSIWSENISNTIVRSMHLSGKVIVAFYISSVLNRDDLIKYLFYVSICVVFSGAGLAIFRPDIGTMGYRGDVAWTGFFTHKSGFGFMASVAALLCVYFLLIKKLSPLVCAFALCVSLISLIKSESATSVAALLLAISFLIFEWYIFKKVPSINSRYILHLLLFFIFLLSAILSVLVYQEITTYLGRDLTISGRTVIWGAALEVIAVRPMLGYGFSAAWSAEVIGPVLARLGRWAPNTHNSFIQALLELGIVGGLLFTCVVAKATQVATKMLISMDSREVRFGAICVSLLMLLILQALVEVALYDGQQINFFMLVALMASMKNSREPNFSLSLNAEKLT
ncbi:O-antigen ligase family protein [Pannonibacter phragmitetus]|uniref:O-antigen ligase family protein n=1 Tax=Pannonibacter phragmitetus TaxID=121719 RepID=UPI000B96D000|nr:O-antigen ligase family protein [Pannonibacter phragmitetus]